MRRRILTLFALLALMTQICAVGVSAFDTYMEDPMYWNEIYEGDRLYEESTITFDSFTTRQLADIEVLRCGIDVSSYQANIDWEAVKNDGVEFAFIRVGYRGWGTGRLVEDSYYRKNIEGALAAGIRVGVYVYSQAITVEEGIEEAQFLMERVAGYDISLPLIMDYEYDNGKVGRLYEAKLTKEEATQIYEAFRKAAEAQGYHAALYANKSFLNNQLNAGALNSVWLAHYATETDYTGDYDFWQCTSSGTIQGITTGLVDLNFWFDDGTFQSVLPFRDVAIGDWAYAGIRYAYENGIVKGKSDNQFAPKDNATRGEVATMLYRLVNEPAVTGQSTFTDLTQTYYKDAITWAHQQGVIKGRTETTFDPDAPVTREELVTMLYRLVGEPTTSFSLSGFSDAQTVSNYARNAMAWAVENGIIKGQTTTTLNPQGKATREQIATILMRFSQLS